MSDALANNSDLPPDAGDTPLAAGQGGGWSADASRTEFDGPEIVDAEIVDGDGFAHPGRQQVYVVPQRFGMSAILGIMTALAVMFGILQSLNAHPFTYLFLGVLSLVICLVQMCFGGVPRVASVAAGTVVFAVFVLTIPLVTPRVPLGLVLMLFVLSLPFGGFLGYLTGTCAAGVFLIMDQLERFFHARRGVELATTASSGTS